MLEVASEALGLTMIAQGRFNKQTPDEYQAEYKKALEGAEQQRNLRSIKNLCDSLNDTHKSFEIHRQTLQKAEGIYLQEKLVEAAGQRPKLSESVATQAETAISSLKLSPMEAAAFRFQLGLVEGRLSEGESLTEEAILDAAKDIQSVAQRAVRDAEERVERDRENFQNLNAIPSIEPPTINAANVMYATLFQKIVTDKPFGERNTDFDNFFADLEANVEQQEKNDDEQFALYLFLQSKPNHIAGYGASIIVDDYIAKNNHFQQHARKDKVNTYLNTIRTMYDKDPVQYFLTYGKNEKLKGLEHKLGAFFAGGEMLTEDEKNSYLGAIINENLAMGRPVEELQFLSNTTKQQLAKECQFDQKNLRSSIKRLHLFKQVFNGAWPRIQEEFQQMENAENISLLLLALDIPNITPVQLENVLAQKGKLSLTKYAPNKTPIFNIPALLSHLKVPVDVLNVPDNAHNAWLERQALIHGTKVTFALTTVLRDTAQGNTAVERMQHMEQPLKNGLIFTLGMGQKDDKDDVVQPSFTQPVEETDMFKGKQLIETAFNYAYGNKYNFASLSSGIVPSIKGITADALEEARINRIVAIPKMFKDEPVDIAVVLAGMWAIEKELDLTTLYAHSVYPKTMKLKFLFWKLNEEDNYQFDLDSDTDIYPSIYVKDTDELFQITFEEVLEKGKQVLAEEEERKRKNDEEMYRHMNNLYPY